MLFLAPDGSHILHCVQVAVAGGKEEWLYLTMKDKHFSKDEVLDIDVFTDADWAGGSWDLWGGGRLCVVRLHPLPTALGVPSSPWVGTPW